MPTKIEWCDETLNPVAGCTKVGEACRNCYAEKMANRLAWIGWGKGKKPLWDKYAPTVDPFGRWNGYVSLDIKAIEKAQQWKKPKRIFIASMGDLFHEGVPFQFIDDVFDAMLKTPHHVFMILTKRIKRAYEWLDSTSNSIERLQKSKAWIGCSIWDQPSANENIPILIRIPADLLFVSAEPLLNSIDLTELSIPREVDERGFAFNALTDHDDEHFYNDHRKLGWVICGGETTDAGRPTNPNHVRALRDQCQASGTPFFFKGWGEWGQLEGSGAKPPTPIRFWNETRPGEPEWIHGYTSERTPHMVKVGKPASGRELDGRTWEEFPDERS